MRLWKGTCFCRRVLLLSSLFSHPESCLKIEFIVGKSDVLGEAPGKGAWEEKDEKKKRKNKRKKNEKNEKLEKLLELVQHSSTRKQQTSQAHHDYRRALRSQPNTNRVGALISSHPGDEVTPVSPGRTSTVHRCLVRQEGCGWPTTKPLRTRRCE